MPTCRIRSAPTRCARRAGSSSAVCGSTSPPAPTAPSSTPSPRSGSIPTSPSPERGETLRSVVAPGWSGAHKWADRSWLEEVEAELGEEVPLILDADGQVLEAGRANVFAVVDDGLLTPPADERILPGTARAATIELAGELGIPVAERRLTLADLEAADAVFLTSSVRGLRPARSLDGRTLRSSGNLVALLASQLRSRWHGAAARG